MRQDSYPGMVVRQKSPLNLEGQFSSVKEWLTPTTEFFVRNHFPTPELSEDTWRLRIEGAVKHPLEWNLSDLRRRQATTLAATVECAGNGRVYYEPVREGLQWQSGAVGNASWTGVRLRDLLEEAGIAPGAVEVVLIGADRGPVDGGKKTASPGPIAFARSLPLDTALADNALLAYAMNGEPLTRPHGYPLRAVVGGWFGMAWVKWITTIRVVERPFSGYWQTRDYFRWERGLGEPILVPLTHMPVKAQIARPILGSTLPVHQPYRVFGAAWSGEAPVTTVEISTDGGQNWQQAALIGPEAEHAWRFWEYYWTPQQTGPSTLLCRATDALGNVQPDCQQPDRESYMANWSIPVEVTVIESPEANADSFDI